MAVINCPNCGAPLTHLTSGDICEYCGSSFPLSTVRDEQNERFYNDAMKGLSDYSEWRRVNIDTGVLFGWF